MLGKMVVFFLFMLAAGSCSRGETELLTGRGLNAETRELHEITETFAPNEPFSLVLKNAVFNDTYVDVIIHHIPPDKTPVQVRAITLSNIATDVDYLQFQDSFAIPYPGRYRIEFSQLTETLAAAEVTITDFQEEE